MIRIWANQSIDAGTDWSAETERALGDADVALLLVSADSLASKFITDVEVVRFHEKRLREGFRLIPVLLSPCAWQAVPWLAKIQCIRRLRIH